jgi:protoporphyrin/coproporphyrin ferrochelatase
MARYTADPVPANRSDAARAGVLLINLGTPEAPTTPAVRKYLREFLSDPRVVEIPRPLWWLILNAFVLPRRPKASAARYAQIWTPEGSPLKVYTERETRLLQGYLGERLGPGIEVDYAMRYGMPSIEEKIALLKARGCDRIVLLPLYPQYSASTTATAFDEAFRALARLRNQPAVRTVRDFHDDPGYVAALAASVQDYWKKYEAPQMLVMSFHGVPQRTTVLGDPYQNQCATTAALLAEALDLSTEQWKLTFQSRFGRAEWLKPYTSEVLTELGQRKLGRVDVICPGFVCDCLETLEEIAIEGRQIYNEAGGGELRYIPCLNDRHEWIQALTEIAARNLHGWVQPAAAPLPQARFPATSTRMRMRDGS